MSIIPMVEVESSQIHSIGHDPKTNTLAIRFTRGFGANRSAGSLYHYQHFTASEFDAFQGAESKGRHFGQHIKPFAEKYPYTRIAD